jgi:hypothetical protein
MGPRGVMLAAPQGQRFSSIVKKAKAGLRISSPAPVRRSRGVLGLRDGLCTPRGQCGATGPSRHLNIASDLGSPNGVRTRVSTLRGRTRLIP